MSTPRDPEDILNALYAQEPMSPEVYEAFMTLKPPEPLSEETTTQMVDELIKVQQEVKRIHEKLQKRGARRERPVDYGQSWA